MVRDIMEANCFQRNCDSPKTGNLLKNWVTFEDSGLRRPKQLRATAYGLKEHEFDGLSPSVRRKLVRLMARIAEKSYRRGFQHGAVLGNACIDPADLRFRRSLDKSPYTDSPNGGHTSIERPFMECGVLGKLGFDNEQR